MANRPWKKLAELSFPTIIDLAHDRYKRGQFEAAYCCLVHANKMNYGVAGPNMLKPIWEKVQKALRTNGLEKNSPPIMTDSTVASFGVKILTDLRGSEENLRELIISRDPAAHGLAQFIIRKTELLARLIPVPEEE